MDAGQIAQRFPLVARPRPTCGPLTDRVREVCDLARTAAEQPDGGLSRAATAFNKAALIASDCGLPDLARSLCRRHSDICLRAQPLSTQAARFALEPLVNLARLRIRSGDGEGANLLLNALFEAVKGRSVATVDGHHVSFEHLDGTPDEHRELVRWLWAVVLADGARALTAEGRWADALTHLERHKGIGGRMLDGRQVAVIASITEENTDHALRLLRETAPGEPWEAAVTACLTVLCLRRAGRPVDHDLATMLDRYALLDRTPQLAVFHTRLSLTVIDEAGGIVEAAAHRVAADLIQHTIDGNDGYAARDVLAHRGSVSLLTGRQMSYLSELVEVCGLGRAAALSELQTNLSAALDTSKSVLIGLLATVSPLS